MSPNGRWLAYVSDETGERRIYVRPFPEVGTGGQRVVSDGYGDRPLWGRDGRELFYHTDESVMVVPVETGETFRRGAPRRLFSIKPYVMGGFYNWDIAPDGQRFLMVKREGAADADAQPPQVIVTLNWHRGAQAARADEVNVSACPAPADPSFSSPDYSRVVAMCRGT